MDELLAKLTFLFILVALPTLVAVGLIAWSDRRRQYGKRCWPLIAVGLLLAYPCLIATIFCVLPFLLVAFGTILAMVGMATEIDRKPWFRHLLSAGMVGALLGWVAFSYVHMTRHNYERAALKRQYPQFPLAERLPKPPAALKSVALSPAAAIVLKEQDAATLDFGGSRRRRLFRELHSARELDFITASGFGFSRMPTPTATNLEPLGIDPPVRQPTPRPPDQSAGEQESATGPGQAPPAAARKEHLGLVGEFVFEDGWGDLDRKSRLVGFEPHQLTRQYTLGESLKVRRLELVSLLLHPEPCVYVSDNLPHMAEARKVPTRPLDAFETEGLAALRGGETLHYRESATEGRMLGAIRASNRCVTCHQVAEGALLGAFSYRLGK